MSFTFSASDFFLIGQQNFIFSCNNTLETGRTRCQGQGQ